MKWEETKEYWKTAHLKKKNCARCTVAALFIRCALLVLNVYRHPFSTTKKKKNHLSDEELLRGKESCCVCDGMGLSIEARPTLLWRC